MVHPGSQQHALCSVQVRNELDGLVFHAPNGTAYDGSKLIPHTLQVRAICQQIISPHFSRTCCPGCRAHCCATSGQS